MEYLPCDFLMILENLISQYFFGKFDQLAVIEELENQNQ